MPEYPPELLITQYERDGVCVLELKGKITIGQGSVELRKTTRKLFESGTKKMILDFSEIKYMDSSGIGEIVATLSTAWKHECIVVFAGFQSKIKQALEHARNVMAVLETYPSVDEALENIKNRAFPTYITKKD